MLHTQECVFKCARFCNAITVNLLVYEQALIWFQKYVIVAFYITIFFYLCHGRLCDSQIKQNIEVNNLKNILKKMGCLFFGNIDLLIICTMPHKFCSVEY